MEHNYISPADLAIKAFDGAANLAGQLGLTTSAVCKWKKNGLIPSIYQEEILSMASNLNKRLTPRDLICGRRIKK